MSTKINTARPALPESVPATPEVVALSKIIFPGSPRWAADVWAVDLLGPLASSRAPRYLVAGDAQQLSELVAHLGEISGDETAVPAELFAETFNERDHLERHVPAPMFRPSGYTAGVLAGLPRASVTSSLIGSTPVTSDGRLFALAALVDHAQTAGHDVEVEDISVLVAWVIGPRRARRHPSITRSWNAQQVGEVTSGDREASDRQKEARVSEVVAEIVGG